MKQNKTQRLKGKVAIVIGEKELADKVVTIKDLKKDIAEEQVSFN